MLEYLIGFALGWIGCNLWIVYKIYRTLKKLEEVARPNLHDLIQSIPHYYIEQHDSMLLVYNSDDKAFVCQGISADDIAEKLMTNLKVNVAIADHDGTTIIFKNGQAIKP